MKNTLLSTLFAFSVGSAHASPEVAPFNAKVSQKHSRNVVEIALQNSQFSTLVNFLSQAGLVQTLANANDITVLAPTNRAFNKLSLEVQLVLSQNPQLLKEVLLYHVIGAQVLSTELPFGQSVHTLSGDTLRFQKVGSNVFINNDSRVTQVDILGSNGVIHVIDEVLVSRDLLHRIQAEVAKLENANAALSRQIKERSLGGIIVRDSFGSPYKWGNNGGSLFAKDLRVNRQGNIEIIVNGNKGFGNVPDKVKLKAYKVRATGKVFVLGKACYGAGSDIIGRPIKNSCAKLSPVSLRPVDALAEKGYGKVLISGEALEWGLTRPFQ